MSPETFSTAFTWSLLVFVVYVFALAVFALILDKFSDYFL